MTIKYQIAKVKRIPLLLVFVIFLSSIISLVSPSMGFAATNDFSQTSVSITPEKQSESASYYTILSGCFWHSITNNGSIEDDTSNPGTSKWFSSSENAVYMDGKKSTCSDVATAAVALWGWSNYAAFLTDAGCPHKDFQYTCNSDGATRSNNLRLAVLKQVYPDLYNTAVKNNNKATDEIPLGNAALYIRYANIFTNQCSPVNKGTMTELATIDPIVYGHITDNAYTTGFGTAGGTTYNEATTVYTSLNISDNNMPIPYGFTYQTAIASAGLIGDGTQFNSKYLDKDIPINTYGHIDQGFFSLNKGNIDNKADMMRCSDLAYKLSGTNPNYAAAYAKDYTVNERTAQPSVLSGIDTINPTSGTSTSKCAVNTIGWMVCPVINFLAGIADVAFNFLSDNFLLVNPSLLNTDPNAVVKDSNGDPVKDSNGDSVLIGTGAYTAWQTMRTIANVVLVIAFLIIIFSQLTSYGIDNYGIKKLIPKLIIVAVLINLSFFICQIGVDLANILGVGLKSFLGSVVSIPDTAKLAASATGEGWTGIAGTVLAGGTAAGLGIASAGGITLALVALIGMLLSAVIALLMIFFILVVRQMLIILLVVMAPLAFAAYLLPNTKNLFDKWKKIFTQMLMLFPIIGLIFGGSTLASNILKSAWASSGSTLAQIVAAGVLALPLFLVPSVLKGALNGIGTIGAKINGLGSQWGKGVNDTISNSKLNKHLQTERDRKNALIESGDYKYQGKNPFKRIQNIRSNAHRAFNSSNISGKYGDKIAAGGATLTEKIEQENLQLAESRMNRLGLNQDQTRELAMGGTVTSLSGSKISGKDNMAMRQAAIKNVVASNNIDGINSIWDQTRDFETVGNPNYVGTDEAKSLRKVFGDSLQSTSSKPAYIGAGDIAKMRINDTEHGTMEQTTIKAIQAGSYSADKIAKADKDELAFVAKIAHNHGAFGDKQISDDQHQLLAINAAKAMTDPILSAMVGKNRQQIEDISNFTPPPPYFCF